MKTNNEVIKMKETTKSNKITIMREIDIPGLIVTSLGSFLSGFVSVNIITMNVLDFLR